MQKQISQTTHTRFRNEYGYIMCDVCKFFIQSRNNQNYNITTFVLLFHH
jgi:hypothetical protein